ncbi:hypothetical protein, partial [Streptomyces sp. CHA16]|uniref:hypothetical protein n=1 Tax=Streptomyces sp. CHA16 TaxID=2841667 RepID=UPI0020950E06
QLEHITRAYVLAKIEPPTQAVAILAAANAEPTAGQVAAELAADALSNPDPAAFHEDALARIQRAQAGDALKAALGKAIPEARRQAMP